MDELKNILARQVEKSEIVYLGYIQKIVQPKFILPEYFPSKIGGSPV